MREKPEKNVLSTIFSSVDVGVDVDVGNVTIEY